MADNEKIQRLRDPIYDLIVFEKNAVDQVAWSLINSIEFQRLRRIRQLGFSEFVYPSATHTRFAHSIGVFHNARRLLNIIRKMVGEKFDENRAAVAALAALLHDIGHGPFSHTFEGVDKKLKRTKKHEDWSGDIIEGDTQISKILAPLGKNFASDVSTLIRADEPADIYASIVSSQFDADRLDYLTRDRYMTGVGIGRFDVNWLLDCLEIQDVIIGQNTDEEISRHSYVEIPSFVLSEKGYSAAEGYLEARFHLYSNVYFHKTTRSAEKMLGVLLSLLSEALKQRGSEALGLPKAHPMIQYLLLEKPEAAQYIGLDDMAVWSLLPLLALSDDVAMSTLAKRILGRDLFKCVDIGMGLRDSGGDELMRFRKALSEQKNIGPVLLDEPRVAGYDWYSWGDESALKKVLIHDREQNKNYDIGDRSDVVKALRRRQFFRVYVPDREQQQKVYRLWEEIAH
jgi:uncharacterized protein